MQISRFLKKIIAIVYSFTAGFREKIIRYGITAKLKHRSMEYGKQRRGSDERISYLHTWKSGQETTVHRIARSMKRKCLANARERILHHRGTSRILNSTRFPSSLVTFVTVSLSLLFSFLSPVFTISSRFLFYTCRTVMRAPKYTRSK